MNYKDIIYAVRSILKHKNEKEALLGQTFNVFSILKMERKENATHSAFLAELLNPEGSHLKGNIFLKLFVELNSITPFNVNSAMVTTEYPIGIKDIENKSGGRIDILIQDKEGNCISIENKIDASDQEKQIARYCNYKPGRNRVLYLTLYGNEPSEDSKSQLESGKDFFCISYQKDIYNWLKLCLKECVDHPILRESIRQYIFLINKLTNTMENNEMKEIDDLILKNISEVSVLSSNFNRVLNEFRESIRDKTIERCQAILGNEFRIKKGNSISDTYAQIWFYHKEIEKYNCQFGIESFNGRGNFDGDIFVGIFQVGGKYDKTNPCPYFEGEGERSSNWWPRIKKIKSNDSGFEMNLKNETIEKLSKDPGLISKFIDHLANESTNFILKTIE